MKRFHVVDADTLQIRRVNFNLGKQKNQIFTCDFSSANAAQQYISSLDFGLDQFYEIWDDKEQEVIDYRSYFNKTAKSPRKVRSIKR